jgi:hypothetical protein
MDREQHKFPTRSYPYRYRAAPGEEGAEADATADAIRNLAVEPGRLYRFVLGVDQMPTAMSAADPDLPHDPFAELLLRRGIFPLTFRNLLAELDKLNNQPEGLPEQKCFLAADGGQISWTPETATVNRLLRFVVTRARNSEVELMVSAHTDLDATDQFLQLIAWDPAKGAFNFYERRGGTWFWAGNSHHALAPDSRAQGPFDSHVNGSMVMKELRAPWSNWHSMRASIQDNVLSPTDSLRTEALFLSRNSAHELETSVVRPGIERWTRARLKRATQGGSLNDVRYFMRQVLEATTVNLISSDTLSKEVTDTGTLTLPTSFFLNTEALLDIVGLEPDISVVKIPGRFYREALTRYQFELRDETYRQPGDTFFAFLVPEPAFEDLNVLAALVQEQLIDARFAASLLMIDFPNPLFSQRRRKLGTYVPQTANLNSASGVKSDIQTAFVAALEAAEPTLAADSPEKEFLNNWRLPADQWKKRFEQRIEVYFARLQEIASTSDAVDAWIRLAESRRREFRRRPLAEFRLTTPTTNIAENAPTLVMIADGTVEPAF